MTADRAPCGAGLGEPLLAFLGATGVASALYWISRGVPLLAANLHGVIALIFLFTPRLAASLGKRPFDYAAAGATVHPVRLNAAVLGLALVVSWPIFFLAFLGFYTGLCWAVHSPTLGYWADWMAANCGRWSGVEGLHFRVPADFALLALTQIVVVAIPEELFFRGYLYSRLEQRWPSRRQVLGAQVGKTLLVTSALFALGHVLVDFNLQRSAVFFPALVFGWMRARTGSIAAGVVFHALCNLYSELLHTAFFR